MESNVKKTSFNIGYVLLAVVGWVVVTFAARLAEFAAAAVGVTRGKQK